MNKLLWIILFFLLLLIGKRRGVKTFFSFLLSMILIILYIILMAFGFNAIILALIICILASLISVFLLNGYNKKTKAAFIGIIIVLFMVFILTYIIGKKANIGGFGDESLETIGIFSFDINYNMNNVIIGMYLVCVIGTIIDTSISISSAMNEVLENNPKIKEKELFRSGMNIGRDILSTTINTLYFALISTFIGFFMWHKAMTLEYLINYKIFVQNIIQLLITFIGSIIIIPTTSFVSSIILIDKDNNYMKNITKKLKNRITKKTKIS